MSTNESPHFLTCSPECGKEEGKYFGCCPKCGGNDGYMNVRPDAETLKLNEDVIGKVSRDLGVELFENDNRESGQLGKQHWQVCAKCKIKWPVGYNLFSSWQWETVEDWQDNEKTLSTFTIADDWIAENISPSERAMYEVRCLDWQDKEKHKVFPPASIDPSDPTRQFEGAIHATYERLKDGRPKLTAESLANTALKILHPNYKLTWENAEYFKTTFQTLRVLAEYELADAEDDDWDEDFCKKEESKLLKLSGKTKLESSVIQNQKIKTMEEEK